MNAVPLSCSLQPKGGELKAVGRARRGGVEVEGHKQLMNFGAFEAHAGSSLRRATGNMFTLDGRNVQACNAAASCCILLSMIRGISIARLW